MNKILFLVTTLLVCQCCFALRDPTRPVGSERASNSPNGAVVSLIVIGKDRSVANVNGSLVKVGDEVDGLKVVAINANTVRLKGSEGEFSIALQEDMLKKQVKQTKQ